MTTQGTQTLALDYNAKIKVVVIEVIEIQFSIHCTHKLWTKIAKSQLKKEYLPRIHQWPWESIYHQNVWKFFRLNLFETITRRRRLGDTLEMKNNCWKSRFNRNRDQELNNGPRIGIDGLNFTGKPYELTKFPWNREIPVCFYLCFQFLKGYVSKSRIQFESTLALFDNEWRTCETESPWSWISGVWLCVCSLLVFGWFSP